MAELLRNASPNIVIALVGNKFDLAETSRQVRTETGQAYAEEAHLLFTECSARTGDNVAHIFDLIGEKLPKTEEHMFSPRMGAAGDGRKIALGDRDGAGAAPGTGSCC